MLLFQRAQYCPAPPGDSVTRKSLFDSLVSGCVPVLFAKASLRQYLWFFTENEVYPTTATYYYYYYFYYYYNYFYYYLLLTTSNYYFYYYYYYYH